jgi:hypothetical protein
MQGSLTTYVKADTAAVGAAAPATMTVECWIKAETLALAEKDSPFGMWQNTSYKRRFRLHWTSAGAAQFTLKLNDNAFYTAQSVDGLIQVGDWNHFAATVDGTDIKLYLNGVEVASESQGGNVPANSSSVDFFAGYGPFKIADGRYFENAVVYTGNFTPPSAPVTAVQGAHTANVFLPLRDVYTKDWSGKNAVGCSTANVKATNTSNTRWGTAPDYEFPLGTRAFGDKAVVVPGTPDGLTLGTGDFCIDIKTQYFGYSTTFRPLLDFRQNTSDTSNRLGIEAWGNEVRMTVGGVLLFRDQFGSWGGAGSLVTLTRENGVFRLFHNGELRVSHTATVDLLGPGTEGIQIGEVTGFTPTVTKTKYNFGSIRITKGVARHTANYTSPVAEVPNGYFPTY